MNKYRLLRIAPMTEGLRLRIRRSLLDQEIEQERRQISRHGNHDDPTGTEWSGTDWGWEYQLLEEDEARFHYKQLLSRARKLRISIPSVFDGEKLSADYQRSGLNGRSYFLSLTGEQKLRSAIREEEKYLTERRARLIPYITAVSGLIGTITGLVAVLIKSGSGHG